MEVFGNYCRYHWSGGKDFLECEELNECRRESCEHHVDAGPATSTDDAGPALSTDDAVQLTYALKSETLLRKVVHH